MLRGVSDIIVKTYRSGKERAEKKASPFVKKMCSLPQRIGQIGYNLKEDFAFCPGH